MSLLAFTLLAVATFSLCGCVTGGDVDRTPSSNPAPPLSTNAHQVVESKLFDTRTISGKYDVIWTIPGSREYSADLLARRAQAYLERDMEGMRRLGIESRSSEIAQGKTPWQRQIVSIEPLVLVLVPDSTVVREVVLPGVGPLNRVTGRQYGLPFGVTYGSFIDTDNEITYWFSPDRTGGIRSIEWDADRRVGVIQLEENQSLQIERVEGGYWVRIGPN